MLQSILYIHNFISSHPKLTIEAHLLHEYYIRGIMLSLYLFNLKSQQGSNSENKLFQLTLKKSKMYQRYYIIYVCISSESQIANWELPEHFYLFIFCISNDFRYCDFIKELLSFVTFLFSLA